MKLCTIGFTNKPAEDFFNRMKNAGVKRLIDVRLNNVSQLAGFAKRDDLAFFTRSIIGAEYLHLPLLAPTKEMLDEYRKEKRGWPLYQEKFLSLMKEREIEKTIPADLLENSCLLCSEDKPHLCHRRLVAEYLNSKWGNIQIEHL